VINPGGLDPGLGPAPSAPDPLVVSPAQAQVLELLSHASVRGVTVAAVARQLGQHPNTIREHLDALHANGYVKRLDPTPGGGRGRPSHRYAVTAAPESPAHTTLITALAEHLDASPGGPGVAEELGYAAATASRVATPRSTTGESGESGQSVADRVLTSLATWGFAFGATTTDHVEIVRCPLVSAARVHPEVICGFHRGVVRGLVAAAGGQPADVTLREFDGPGRCSLWFAPELQVVVA
jgi:predicted ArsR family transcriptional regulator